MFHRKRSTEDFAEEIKAHLELEADDLKHQGLSEDEARRKARCEFGNVSVAQERFYIKDRWVWLDRLLRDLRFGLHSMRQSPGFAITAILTLALGMGANTAVFSVMNAVLLRALPVKDPQQLVYLRTSGDPRGIGTIDTHETFSCAVYDALRQQKRGLSPVMAYVPLSGSKVVVRFGPEPEEATGDMVSGDFFSGLGVKIARGRGFTEQDEASHAPIAVISYDYWTQRFSRNPDVLGKTFYVNSVPLTIVGVSAQGFQGLESGSSTDFWIPLQGRVELNAWGNPPEDGKIYIANPKWWCLGLIGRLAPGVSKAQATAALQSAFQTAAYDGIGAPQPGERKPILSLTEAKGFRGYDAEYGKPLKMLMAMVGLVLLIALSNVVMLVMARNATRQREFSMRLALGAGRWDLFQLLLTESLLLVAAGGALAWLFATYATKAMGAWAQIHSSLAPDTTVLLFTLAVLAFAAVLFGLAPLRAAIAGGAELAVKPLATISKTDVGTTKVGKVIVALQMALCVVLLVGAALLTRTLRNLKNTPLGFPTQGLVVFGVKPDIHSVPEGVAFYQELMSKLRVLPGVEAVSIMQERIGSGSSDNSDMTVDGKPPDVANGTSRTVRSNVVGPDFFHTLGVPVLAGRDFTDADTATAPHVGIINEEFAKRFLPNRNPLGHHIGPSGVNYQMTIVGVVKDHKYRSIEETPIPMAWYMYDQIPVIGQMSVEMRVRGEPLAILPTVQKVVAQMDPNLVLIQPTTQRAQYDSTISQQVLFARLSEFFGLLAILLVATGLYGTMAYRVNMRTAEIGVRMAVGARRGQVVWMVLRDSLLLTAIGVVLGIPLAILVGEALASSLYGVKPLDVLTYLLAVVGVAMVALAASAVPAGRAASVDPMTALHTD